MTDASGVLMVRAIAEEYSELLGFSCSQRRRLRPIIEARAALYEVITKTFDRRTFSEAMRMDRTTTYNIDRNLETYNRFSNHYAGYLSKASQAYEKVKNRY
jgi:hypothetical protein